MFGFSLDKNENLWPEGAAQRKCPHVQVEHSQQLQHKQKGRRRVDFPSSYHSAQAQTLSQ